MMFYLFSEFKEAGSEDERRAAVKEHLDGITDEHFGKAPEWPSGNQNCADERNGVDE